METCQICNQEAHGNHFGAITCRACAAFFRRFHCSIYSSDRLCQRSSKCGPDDSGRWHCKKCRWDRCISEGMAPGNIQLNRDAFKSSDQFLRKRKLTVSFEERVPVSVNQFLGIPTIVSFKRKETVGRAVEFYVDMSRLVDKATGILKKRGRNSEITRKMSNLEQLSHGLGVYRSAQKDNLWDDSKITKESSLRGWEENLFSVAEWLNYSEEIRRLPLKVKEELLQCSWVVWGKLERVAMTAQWRVNRMCGKRQFIASHHSLVDYDKLTADISWWSNFSFEELNFIFTPTDIFYDQLIQDFCEIQPDQIELTYLLCTLCFGLTGKLLGGDMEVITDRLQAMFGNDLHDYYTKQGKGHYVLRMRQLMRISDGFVKTRNNRSEKYEICARLNVFQSNFSHGQYFRITC